MTLKYSHIKNLNFSVHVPQPYPVEKIVHYPVKVPVDRPYPVHVDKPVPYEVIKKVPYEVIKNVPVPVHVPGKRSFIQIVNSLYSIATSIHFNSV